MISIEDFCKLHDACSDGRDWALANCKTMADVWATARPEWLVWVATRPGVLDDRTLRLFAVDCARSVENLLTDDRSRNAIDVAERFANGDATLGELIEARDAARAAAWDAAMDASQAVARAAAWAAARAAARAAAWDAAMDAARDAARAAAWAAARDAARAAAGDASQAAARAAAWDAAMDASQAAAWGRQAIWLRQHCTPNFSMGGE